MSTEILELFNSDWGSEWRGRAACLGKPSELWFVDVGGSTAEGKAICFTCEVRQECLDYALDTNQQYGIFGGLTIKERRKIKKERGDYD